MGWVVVILLTIVILVFGCTSSAQSYATAQQAQAQIEVAKVAQTQAWTNMISMMVLAVVILLILFALVALIILAIRFLQVRAETSPIQLYQPRHAARLADSQPHKLLPPGAPTTEIGDLAPEEIELIQRLLKM